MKANNERHLVRDEELQKVYSSFLDEDPTGARTEVVIQGSFDFIFRHRAALGPSSDRLSPLLLRGVRSMIMINFQREFCFDDGVDTDFSISGVDVACIYSDSTCDWIIPPSNEGLLCLLISASYCSKSIWSIGLLRANKSYLSPTAESHRTLLNAEGLNAIAWMFQNRKFRST